MDRFVYAADYAMEGNTLSGVAHVFGTRTQRDGVLHEYSATAFGKAQPLAFYAHDTTKPLAAPTLSIVENKLHFSLELGHQSYAEDLRENQRMGLMNAMSFGVVPRQWKDSRQPDGSTVRLYTRADLFDISPVATNLPAFQGTTAQLHSLAFDDETIRSQLIRARHRVATENNL